MQNKYFEVSNDEEEIWALYIYTLPSFERDHVDMTMPITIILKNNTKMFMCFYFDYCMVTHLEGWV